MHTFTCKSYAYLERIQYSNKHTCIHDLIIHHYSNNKLYLHSLTPSVDQLGSHNHITRVFKLRSRVSVLLTSNIRLLGSTLTQATDFVRNLENPVLDLEVPRFLGFIRYR